MTGRRAAMAAGFLAVAAVCGLLAGAAAAADRPANTPPDGFTALFNGKDLAGWKGLVGDPKSRAAMKPEELAEAQKKADADVAKHWRVENGEIVNDGQGPHLCTVKPYGDFELWVDWKIAPGGDSGIYLRGSPQVQIWDPVAGIDQAKVGSGGLYNNQKNPSKPLVVADKPAGEWNTFYIRMVGELVTVKLNGQLVVDNVVMENYWDRARPIYPSEQLELQTHGGLLRFRNVYIHEISPDEADRDLRHRDGSGFMPLFNGKDLQGWQGSVDGYVVQDGLLVCDPAKGGTLLTKGEFGDFILRFEFRLPPGGNNGLAIRAPADGNPAYAGMEIQILDDTAAKHADLKPWQYHGSVYGIAAAQRGYTRPVGQWNFEEVTAKGSHITVKVNGTTIIDADVEKVEKPADSGEHPGIHNKTGLVGFMGHGDRVEFRNIRIKPLDR
ncbi:MAG: DUF1080 domain-containing protein [Planctomycetes bacterium]|nr:DUF1080 domain-containing protein [Planctomycetota bacterium]